MKFRMDQQGLGPRDLVPMIGQLNRVYEVLARRRPLTLAMVWRLHLQLGNPAASLIRPSALALIEGEALRLPRSVANLQSQLGVRVADFGLNALHTATSVSMYGPPIKSTQ
jgi:hypothetical protein